MNLRNKIICILLFIGCCGLSKAQTLKRIEVSDKSPYVDHISMQPGTTDMDLIVKIAFDEPNNTLTVSLISYRKLFVFYSDVRYSQAVRNRKLKPGRLPYLVESDQLAKYPLSKALRKSLGRKKKCVFKNWIAYEGLQPQPTDYKMVNDYIEQRFDIIYKEADVVFTLRDILVMEEQTSGKKPEYKLFFKTDLDRKYEVSVKRDPCFGKEEAIELSASQLENIKTSYAAFIKEFGTTTQAKSPESEKMFNKMKSLLTEQFPKKDETSDCTEIQNNINLYNCYADSIQQRKYKYRTATNSGTLKLSADYILNAARNIDSQVNKWLRTSDPVEKKDLEAACQSQIDKIQSQIKRATKISNEQKAAIRIFDEAGNYFRRTCVKK